MDGAGIRQLDRRRDLPVHQRVRGGADRAEDRLDAPRRSSTGSASGSSRSAPRASGSSARASRPCAGRRARPRSARSTRPASATRSGPASWPGSRGACRWSGAPQVGCAARDVRHRDRGHPGVRAGPAAVPRAARGGLRRRRGRRRRAAPAVPAPLTPVPRRRRSSRRRPGTASATWPRPGPGEDLLGVGADLEPGTVLAAYRAGLFPMPVSRRGADRLVVAGPARRPAAGRAAGQPVAARSLPALRDPGRHGVRRGVAGLRRPARPRRLDHARSRARPTAGCTSSAGRTASRPGGGTASWRAGCTASRSAACSRGSRCSTGDRDASKVALVGLVELLAPTAGRAAARRAVGTEHLARWARVEVARPAYLTDARRGAAPHSADDGSGVGFCPRRRTPGIASGTTTSKGQRWVRPAPPEHGVQAEPSRSLACSRGPHRRLRLRRAADLRDAGAGRDRPGACASCRSGRAPGSPRSSSAPRLGPDPVGGHLPPARARRDRPAAADPLQPADRGPLHRRPADHRSRSSSTSPPATRPRSSRSRRTPTTRSPSPASSGPGSSPTPATATSTTTVTGTPGQAADAGPARRARRCGSASSSDDVIHSFWVPAFLFKLDVIPGRTEHVRDRPRRRSGTYAGKCAELCGQDHSRMLFNVEVVPPAEYDGYVGDLQSGGLAVTLSDHRRRTARRDRLPAAARAARATPSSAGSPPPTTRRSASST